MRRIVPLLLTLASAAAFADPAPGELFREYTYGRRFGEVDPGSKHSQRKGPPAERPLDLPSLNGVTRAEVSVEYWGGHMGTSGQKFQINDAQWFDIPQPKGTPRQPECAHRTLLGRATVDVPVDALRQGRNIFRFAAGPQLCHSFDWGFYWVYAFTVRLYYKGTDDRKTGRIVSPADGEEIGENPRFAVDATRNDIPLTSVEFIAKYEDFNWEGDGIFRQWHYITQRGRLAKHIGTTAEPPYTVTWNTAWIPDQDEAVEVAARVTDLDGLIYMTPAVKVNFKRSGRSVKMYKAFDIPNIFAARIGRRRECKFKVDGELSRARAARLVLSTWSAAHGEDITLNGSKLVDRVGLVHNYSFDSVPVPVRTVRPGENVFSIFSNTTEHAAEVNWPGPVLLIEYGPPEPKPAASVAWYDRSFRQRVAVEVDPAGVPRFDAVAEAQVPLPAKPGAMRVVEIGTVGEVKDAAVPFQVDAGTLALLLKGRTGPQERRRYHLYFGGKSGGAASEPLVAVTDNVDCAGQPSFRVKTPTATYCYQKEGAGFASILDAAGNEWIGYRPGGRSAGEFRGIPNLGDDFGHPGHSGEKGSTSRLVASGPLKVSILSERRDGKWAARWDIFPSYARMTMLRNAKPYWFLYEGTPGGKLDTANSFQVTSDGMRRTLAQAWSGDMQGPEWIYFGNTGSRQVLFVARHEDDDTPEQYWPMDGNMTVFGFGRQFRCCAQYLTASPARFTVGMAPNGSFNAVSDAIESAYRDLRVETGVVEKQ